MKPTLIKIGLRVTALLLLSPLVFAIGGKTFTWTPPTENVDNSPLAQSEIVEYRIYCDGQIGAIWTQPNQPLNTDTWIAPDGTFANGRHSCYATTIANGVDENGDAILLESEDSNTVNFIVSPARPRPPVFAVQ